MHFCLTTCQKHRRFANTLVDAVVKAYIYDNNINYALLPLVNSHHQLGNGYKA